MKTIYRLCFSFLLSAGAASAVEFDFESLPGKLSGKVQTFFATDTGRARTQIAAFSDEELQKVTTEFKKAHPAAEQRIFWLIEESYRRNAERVAAERMKFLFIAVLAALGIIAGFTGLTYARTRNLAKSASARVAPQPPTIAPQTPRTLGNKNKKGRRK